MRKRLGIIVLAGTAATAGCLQKDTTHTLYLSPDGRMSWMAVEASVRSDDSDAGRRATEEQSYLASAAVDSHGIGLGLASLDPERLQTRVIRSERPFFVITEAHFSSVENMIRRLLVELQVDGNAKITRRGNVATLLVRIDATAAVAGDAPSSEAPVVALAEDLERYSIVLTEGRFIAATGFSLHDSATRAVPIETPWEKIEANGGILEMSLTWTR